MSQDDVLKALAEKKEPLTSKELAEYIGIQQHNIISALKKLIKQKEVKARKPTRKELEKKGYSSSDSINSRMRVFIAVD